jgi:hypothetical protein
MRALLTASRVGPTGHRLSQLPLAKLEDLSYHVALAEVDVVPYRHASWVQASAGRSSEMSHPCVLLVCRNNVGLFV